jgi:predicted PurR-regulated permease PerM
VTREAPRPGDDRTLRALTRLLAIVAVTVALYAVQGILLPFALAGIVAFLCKPLVECLTARTRAPRWVIASALLLSLMGGATIIGVVLLPPLYADLVGVAHDLPSSVHSLIQQLFGGRAFTLLGLSLDPSRLATAAVGALQSRVNADTFGALAALGFEGFFAFILFWVLLAYFLIDTERTVEGLIWLVPPESRSFAARVWRDLRPKLRRYFVGIAVIFAYATGVAYLGLGWFLGLHHAALLALLTGVLETIPVIGPAGAALIGGMVALHEASSTWNVVAYVCYALAIRLSIDQVVGPLVLGKAAGIRPALVIFCFLAGGALFGITGVILSVPTALAVKSVLALSYENSADDSQD